MTLCEDCDAPARVFIAVRCVGFFGDEAQSVAYCKLHYARFCIQNANITRRLRGIHGPSIIEEYAEITEDEFLVRQVMDC